MLNRSREASGWMAGVVEGFYGAPWSLAEREEVFRWMADGGLNTYLYAPKDDLHHRTLWRDCYSAEEAAELRRTVDACSRRGLEFVYGIGPGLDLRYSHAPDLEALRARLAQMAELGARHFCLLFDDIPDQMDPADAARWNSLAAAQAEVTNELFRWLRERLPTVRMLFCPTPYCGRMVTAHHGGPDYLPTLGAALAPEIDVLWTGPEIISRDIEVSPIRKIAQWLRRQPLIWDNLHANDYDGRRFYVGPYAGRPTALRGEIRGVLTNPNNEAPLNFVAVRTLAAWCRTTELWVPREAYLEALRAWFPRFALAAGAPLTLEDLELFADCFYLPYEEGTEAERLRVHLEEVLPGLAVMPRDKVESVRRDVIRLRDICARLANLRDRPMFHALSRRVWELREELDLLDRCLAHHLDPVRAGTAFRSDFHLPLTYRGGFVVRLQRLLIQRSDGAFEPRQDPQFHLRS